MDELKSAVVCVWSRGGQSWMFSFQAPDLCSTATLPIKNYQEEQAQNLTPPGKGPVASVRSPNCGRQQASVRGARLNPSSAGASGGKNRAIWWIVILPQNTGLSLASTFSGGRSLPRSLLGPNVSSDSEGGVFAIPTTLPPNSSRHNRMFSPNKEAELFRQQLDSISVRRNNVWSIPYLTSSATNEWTPAGLRIHYMYLCRCIQIFSSPDRENLATDNYGNHWWFRYENGGSNNNTIIYWKSALRTVGLGKSEMSIYCCKDKTCTCLSYLCFICSGHSYPELQEILLSTSAPSLSSPTHQPQVRQTTAAAEMLLLFWNLKLSFFKCKIDHTLGQCALALRDNCFFFTLNRILAFYIFFFPLHRNWLLPANPDSPGSLIPPPSVQSFPCSVHFRNSYSALQYVLPWWRVYFYFFPLAALLFLFVQRSKDNYLFYTSIFVPMVFLLSAH